MRQLVDEYGKMPDDVMGNLSVGDGSTVHIRED
jgi:hypothetical protein